MNNKRCPACRFAPAVLVLIFVLCSILQSAGCSAAGHENEADPRETQGVDNTEAAATASAEADPRETQEVIYSGEEKRVVRYSEYYKAAEAVLSGEKYDGEAFGNTDNCVYFNIEENELIAYSTMIIESEIYANAGQTAGYRFEDPIDRYPRELGETAARRLGEIGNKLAISSGEPASLMMGFICGDHIVFVTVDDSMQDIQASCIFHYNGTEWVELHDNNNICHTMYGAGFANDEVGFLSYYSKHLNTSAETGGKLFVWRTEDAGASWEQLDLNVAEYFAGDELVYACALSPVFDGEHGVMLATGLLGRGERFNLWLETYDLGLSWAPVSFE